MTSDKNQTKLKEKLPENPNGTLENLKEQIGINPPSETGKLKEQIEGSLPPEEYYPRLANFTNFIDYYTANFSPALTNKFLALTIEEQVKVWQEVVTKFRKENPNFNISRFFAFVKTKTSNLEIPIDDPNNPSSNPIFLSLEKVIETYDNVPTLKFYS